MYKSDQHKSELEALNRHKEEHALSVGNDERLRNAMVKELSENEAYTTLSREQAKVLNRATSLEVLYNMVMTYDEGKPLSGEFAFSALAKGRIFGDGMTFDENLASFNDLLNSLISSSEENLVEFKRVAGIILDAVKPHLESFCLKSSISAGIELRLRQQMQQDRTSKKGRK